MENMDKFTFRKRKAIVEIEEKDIATIEALHDLLLDEAGFDLSHPTLERARKLTAKLYKGLSL